MGRNHDISPFLFPSQFPSESTPGSPLSPSSPSYSSRSTSNLNSSYKSSSSIAGAAPSQCSFVQPPPADDAYVGPCAACKINGRRCSDECYLASYFPSNELHKFSVVDRVFGWENLRNFLQENSNSSNIPLLLVMRDTSQDGEVQSHPKNICVLSEYSNIDNQLDTTTSLVPINPDHFSPNTIMQSKSKNDFPSNPSLGSINDKTQVHKQEFSIPIFSQTSQDRNKALKSLTSAKVYGSRDVNHEALESIPVEFGRATDHLLQSDTAVDALLEKRIRRIHKALDSDDVELVKLLLTESNVTLDDANALHYVVAYCDPKVVSEILGLNLADVNRRNSQGYTVLHIAAMRRQPSVIVSLLSKGACALDITLDGRSAVSICRRLTRPKDYHAKTEQGQEANKDRLCIDVLEREMRRNPMAGDSSITCHTISDDLHMKLLYLENRVAFARLFFPTEAKVAMEIANAETTREFVGLSPSKGSNKNLAEVDLNETPANRNKRLHTRLEELLKTVEMGRRFFPNCSEVLDKFMEDDLPDLFYLEKGTPDEQRLKRMRFMELKEDVQKAFSKDKAERSLLSASSCSSTLRDGSSKKLRKL